VTLADRLEFSRRRRFVGRAAELELFHGALGARDEAFAVLFVHGPGGVGKSALLAEYARAARAVGRLRVSVDGHALTPSPAGFRAALAESLGVPADAEVADALRADTHVVFVDTFERLAPLEGWLRDRFLPTLPAGVVVVVAGRRPPTPYWLADPGWRDVLRVISLRNLSPDGTREYLELEGLPAAVYAQVAALTHGHPLALSLLVDALRRSGDPGRVPRSLADAPDIVAALLARIVDEAPGSRHLTALHVCGHAAFTTEGLLRAVLPGDDGPELFAWLRDLSFVEETARGLRPHDVARDVLDADLAWRDPATFAAVHRQVRRHLVDQVRTQAAQATRQDAVADVVFMGRDHPVAGAYWDWGALGHAYADRLTPDEIPLLLDMTRARVGEEQAALAAHWLERQPEAFRVFRRRDGSLLGYAAYLSLDQASADDIDADPGSRAMWAQAQRHSPPRPGEGVKAWRFLVDAAGRGERELQTAGTMLGMWHAQDILLRGPTAWDLIGTYTDLEHWRPFLAHYDFHHVPGADYQVDGRTYVVFAHDWRRVGVQEWLDVTGDRELGAPPATPPPRSTEVVLSQDGFRDAVKHALRHLHDRAALSGNPLIRSAMVQDLVRRGRPPDPPDEVLRDLILVAADALRADPRAGKLHRVLDRTFMRPAPSQEKAAEILDLPFSTYRRHRDRAVAAVTRWLWERELYRPTDDPTGRAEVGSD
jgi:AAA ATPase domain